MKVFVISDIHIDYAENRRWLIELSNQSYKDDILILAGDLTEDLAILRAGFEALTSKFKHVLYVSGNHELWVSRNSEGDSIEKFYDVCRVAEETGVLMEPLHEGNLSIVPMASWYDFSFGEPEEVLLDTWMDFRMCRWPSDMALVDVNNFFLEQNNKYLDIKNELVISFSHFLPRIDLMPSYIPPNYRFVYPVLGTNALEKQVRMLNPNIHIYGHSHVNRQVTIDGVKYINNAFGYPSEQNIAMKELLCVHRG